MVSYESDAIGYKSYQPDAVAIPGNIDELTALIEEVKRINVPWVVRGAGTSLSGGPVAAQNGLVIHLSKLSLIEEVNPKDKYVVVQSGVTLKQLNRQLEAYDLYYPPDPSSEIACTLGGNVACNSGGSHCFRYGVTSNYVLGVEAILTDGSIVQFGGPAGGRGNWKADWKRLFIGSEGTLGVFTRFWLRVVPKPEKVWTFRASFSNFDQAVEAINQLVSHHSFPSAIEFMDPRSVNMVENSPMSAGIPKDSYLILTEIDGPTLLVDSRVNSVVSLLKACGSVDVAFSDHPEKRSQLWKARKVMGGLMGQVSPNFLVQDAVIPKKHLKEALRFIYEISDAHHIKVATILHAGDGNLHPNLLFDSKKPEECKAVEQISKELMKFVIDHNGTLSGEHGIGNDKSHYTSAYFGKCGKDLQLSIAHTFNPTHRLNPLKIFPDRRFEENNTSTPKQLEA